MPNMMCLVVTPTHELFSGEIAYADIPGADGHYGVLKGHETLLALNSPGVLTLWMDADGKEKRRFALYEGCTKVSAETLVVLARFGTEVSNIDAEVVGKKAAAMKERIVDLEAKHKDDPKADFYGAILETSKARLAWYETQLNVAKGMPVG